MTTQTRSVVLTWWWLVPLLLVVAWLGARSLNVDPIWIDERFSLRDAGIFPQAPNSLMDIWTRVATGNPWHAPGFFFVLASWGRLVGTDPVVLRAFSLFFGLLTVAWTYRFGTDLISRRVGVFAALLLGTSAYFVNYLHEIRMYTIDALFSIIVLWAYFRIISFKKEPGWLVWLALVLSAALLPYTHYFTGLLLVAIGVYHLAFGYRAIRRAGGAPRRWWLVLGAFALSFILFLPWVATLLNGIAATLGDEELHELALDNGALLLLLLSLFSNGHVVFFGALLGLSVVGKKPSIIQRLLFIMAVILLLMLVSNTLLELFKTTRVRYVIFLWPIAVWLLAFGIEKLRRWPLVQALVLMACVVMGLTGPVIADYFDRGMKYIFPIQDVGHFLRPEAQTADYVLSYMPEGASTSRYSWLNDFYFQNIPVEYRNLFNWYDTPELWQQWFDEVMTSMGHRERVWLAYRTEDIDPAFELLQATIAESYLTCGAPQAYDRAMVQLYALSEVCCRSASDVNATPEIRFGDLFEVMGNELIVGLDGSVQTTISWRMDPNAELHAYSVTLQLYDSNGEKVGQTDYGLLPGSNACQTGFIDAGDLADGTYEVRAGVYRWQTGESLGGEDLRTGASENLLPLGTVTIGE